MNSLKRTRVLRALLRSPVAGRWKDFRIGKWLRKHVGPRIIPNTSCIVKTNAGFDFILLNPRQSTIGYAVYRYGVWEEEETQWVLDNVEPGMIAVDVGANTGYYSLLFARCIGDMGRVYSFEPLDEFRRQLVDNIRLNN